MMRRQMQTSASPASPDCLPLDSHCLNCPLPNPSHSRLHFSNSPERPDAPAKATIAKVDSRSITVSWSPPYSGNSPILYYIIEFKEVTDEWEPHGKRQRVPGTESKAVVSGLWPGTAYHFRLLAENSLGKSETGVTLHAITELEGNCHFPVAADRQSERALRSSRDSAPTSKTTHLAFY